ncbi:serine/threonine-protein phosphatase 6 regulatory ankyrin repeat subunit B-like [Pecten maximus]|uniref:serine/threonine-protein phosphatase 6 regulatory ankyrin repeat subunit B-like n=1 Tax=Pecten maximus TaxID=6579 RepID=UPI00145903B4|nr:serine/threonine-protein phosphatase 6 regulatory ankyrin repeat subunit B-like [Pecten maximus]XP_033759449.1 serine/threonine-protein phosphatase 6 regulatory ankyrin repeat subunit B-like [Pecten maximus]
MAKEKSVRRRRRPRDNEDYSADMYNAITEDDPDRLARLLDEGADVDHMFFHGMIFVSSKPVLTICCEKGREACAKVLIDHGAEVKRPDKWGLTPLMYCMTLQYIDIAQLLLQRDPSVVKCQDHKGRTALHFAIETGNVELVKILIASDADVNAQERFGMTPLMMVCSSDFQNEAILLDFLLKASADVNKMSFRGKRTALQFAAAAKRSVLVECLLNARSDPNTVDVYGRTPLTNLIWEHARGKEQVDSETMSIIQILLLAGADLNLDLTDNCNPVFVASQCACPFLVQYFLEKGCHPGKTSMLMAVSKGDHSSVMALLNWGFDVNMEGTLGPSKYLTNPMILAIELGHWSIAYMLVTAGFNMYKLNIFRGDNHIPTSLLNSVNVLHHLKELASVPKTLFHMSTLTIWRTLRSNIDVKISQLPLPLRLQKLICTQIFLLYTESLYTF